MPAEDIPNTNQGTGYRTIADKIPENAAEAGDLLATKGVELTKKMKSSAEEGAKSGAMHI